MRSDWKSELQFKMLYFSRALGGQKVCYSGNRDVCTI
jgi:hypothetical protein